MFYNCGYDKIIHRHKLDLTIFSFWFAGLLKFRHMTYQTHVMRWALAAEDICFTRASHAWFFSHGRTIPVVRGGGVYQKGMDYALKKIEDGSWVHTFPEGCYAEPDMYCVVIKHCKVEVKMNIP